MSRPKVSIILPSIRPENLFRWYLAAEKACECHSWEVIIVSPYSLPPALDGIANIKYLKSDRTPTVCKQVGILLAAGRYLFNTTDDAILKPNSIDEIVALYEKNHIGPFGIVNGRYREGALDVQTLEPLANLPPELPPEYWNAHHHQSLRLPGIDKNNKISLHFFMLLDTFYKIGGLNCVDYEYSVFPILELNFRLAFYGGQIIDSTHEVSWCSHLPNAEGDHGPIAGAMQQDELMFQQRWQSNIHARNINIDYENWKSVDRKWGRRFV